MTSSNLSFLAIFTHDIATQGWRDHPNSCC